MFRRNALALAFFFAFAGCTKQMAIQPRYEPQGSSDFFEDHRVERDPIPGTVPAEVDSEHTLSAPIVNQDLLLRGQERYAISCSPCHERTGEGNGPIVQSGFQKPAPLDSPAFRMLKIEALTEIIRDGKGTMAGYRGLIAPTDMIAIAHYVKVLQLRKHVPASWLSAKDQSELGGAK